MPDVIQIAIQATDAASKIIGGVGDSLDRLSKQSEDADKKLKIFGLSTEQIGNKMSQAGKIATVGLTLPIAGLAVAATKAASDLNETSNKIQTLFGNATDSVMKFADTAATSLGQSKKQALDAAADFAVFGKAAGLAGNDLVEFSKQNVKLAADMASFFNTSPEEAITAIGAAFRGESEPIRRYGVLINEANLKDQALRMGLIKTTTEALQPQARVLAAQALILQQTSAAQGDFAKTSDGLANQSRILNAQFQDMIASLGQSLLPIAVKVAGAANDLLTAFNNLDQPQKDLIVGFGLMAAAAGPVLTIGGKLVSTLDVLSRVSVDAVGGFVSMGRTVGETAGYLKQVGVSAESLKFAFQNLKAGGALLGAELGIIVAGLIAIAKYLEAVGVAAKSTNEDLIAMSHSGDIFKQAAATTEILNHSQDRLKVVLDATHDKIRAGAKEYADYKSAIEATAKAAGFYIDEQGNLMQVTQTTGGAIYKVIQANYRLSESNYKIGDSQNYVTKSAGNEASAMGVLGAAIGRAQTASQQAAAAQIQASRDQIEGLKQLAEARTRTGDAEKSYQDEVKKTIDVIKAQNGVIADAYGMAITYTESERKQADIQKELDDLNATIAARGPARVATIQNEKLSTDELSKAKLELAVAQEDLSTVQKKSGETDAEFALRVDNIKNKIADYTEKLGTHTGVVGGATKAEQEHKKALEEQIAALQKSDEVTRAKGAFESLTKAFRDGVLTQEQYTERAGALNSLTGLYSATALTAAISQEELMKAIADPTSEAYRSQLIKNKEAIDGIVTSTDQAADSTDKLNKKQAEAPAAKPAKAEGKAEAVELGGPKVDKSIAAAQAALDYANKAQAATESARQSAELLSTSQEAASRNMKGVTDVIVGGYKAVDNAIADTKQRTAEMTDASIKAAQARSAADEKSSKEMKGNATVVANAYKAIPKTAAAPPVITPKVDTKQAVTDITSLVTNVYGTVPKEKATIFKADTVTATANTQSILKLFGTIPKIVNTFFDVDGKLALQTLDDIRIASEKIVDKAVTFTVNYVTHGSPPEGYQHGGAFTVPPNPRGGMGDYFPVLAAPGERVTIQTPAQQHGTGGGVGASQDTYNYTTNIYNPLAAAMWSDQQRRERIARSNARMGVV